MSNRMFHLVKLSQGNGETQDIVHRKPCHYKEWPGHRGRQGGQVKAPQLPAALALCLPPAKGQGRL